MTSRWLIVPLVSLIATELFAMRNKMAKDYFTYRNVPSVVSFSCANITNDYRLISLLNNNGISVAILNSGLKYSHQLAMRVNYWRLGVFLDPSCKYDYNKLILTESSKYGMYNESYKWLLVGDNFNDTIRILNDHTFSMSTDLVIAIPGRHGYALYDVFNHGKAYGGKLNVTKFGYWQEDTGLNVILHQIKYQRRANLHGMKLKIISITQYRPVETPLVEYLQDDSTRPFDSMSKFGFSILLHMADIFNFTMDLIETGLWDQVASDGSHFGMIGMLNQSKGDFGATSANMFKERTHLCDLIGPVWPFRTCFMFRSSPTPKVSSALLEVFTLESWMTTTFILILCTIVLSLTLKFEHIRDKISKSKTSILVTIGIMCQQASEFDPKYPSGRVVFLQLWIFSLLMYNYLSASIVSVRLYQPIDKMNDSLHQLAESEFQISAEPITYTNYGLTNLNNWEVREFYVKRWLPLSDEQQFMSLEKGFQRVAEGGFAYHTDPNTGYTFVERLFTNQMICELTEVHLFPPQKMALWGRRNSPFTKMARIALAKISNTGLLSRELKRWVSRKPLCFREILSVGSVSIEEAAPAFFIVCAGIILASVLCIIENIIAQLSDLNLKLRKDSSLSF